MGPGSPSRDSKGKELSSSIGVDGPVRGSLSKSPSRGSSSIAPWEAGSLPKTGSSFPSRGSNGKNGPRIFEAGRLRQYKSLEDLNGRLPEL